jgi:integrase/recombinase XerD
MTAWHRALNEYLALRRSVGFKLEEAARVLPRFVTYLERRHASTITSDLALAWAMEPHGKRDLWAVRLGLVRGFARYQQAFDPRTEVPPPELLPQRRRRATPFLYSNEEVRSLVRAAHQLSPPLYAWTYTTLIGLLASTGMRRGEVIRLDREDVDWNHGLLVVRKSKFGKSRELPLHPTTIGALRAYARVRERLCPRPKSPSFFVSLRGTRLLPHRVHLTFRRLVECAGIAPRSAHCRPRIHDLRHSFAIRTMLDWYRAGVDVESRLPLLSTYLGHFAPSTTYWYLSAAPELFALVARRLERASGVLS